MRFDLKHSLAILERTPDTVQAMLSELPEAWTLCDEGDNAWSPFITVAHLVHQEEVNWLPRAKIIVEHGETLPFTSFEQSDMFDVAKGKTLSILLDEFSALRAKSLTTLHQMNLAPEDLSRRGHHPMWGTVALGQLLAAWTVHDLNHIHQIVKTMARQYTDEVGAWRQYLRILDD